MATMLLLIVLLCIVHLSSQSAWKLTLFTSVTRPDPSHRKSSNDKTKYDEFGHIPQLDNAQKALNNAKTVVVVRVSNGTIVGMIEDWTTKGLVVSQGGKVITSLTGFKPHLYLVMTGLVGDGRYIIRKARELFIDHVVDFDRNIPPRILCSKLGDELMNLLMGGGRPLAVHLFILSDKKVWQVECNSAITQIYAGAAGQGRDEALKQLSSRYNSSLTQIDGTALVEEILRAQLKAPDRQLIKVAFIADDEP